MTSKSIQEVAELIANSSPEDAKAIMDAHPTKITVFGHDIPDFLLLVGAKMKDDEYRDLVKAGPAVVMVAKEDMLKLLNRLMQTTELVWWLAEHAGKLSPEEARVAIRVTICDND